MLVYTYVVVVDLPVTARGDDIQVVWDSCESLLGALVPFILASSEVEGAKGTAPLLNDRGRWASP